MKVSVAVDNEETTRFSTVWCSGFAERRLEYSQPQSATPLNPIQFSNRCVWIIGNPPGSLSIGYQRQGPLQEWPIYMYMYSYTTSVLFIFPVELDLTEIPENTVVAHGMSASTSVPEGPVLLASHTWPALTLTGEPSSFILVHLIPLDICWKSGVHKFVNWPDIEEVAS